jgi:hypothetical protein
LGRFLQNILAGEPSYNFSSYILSPITAGHKSIAREKNHMTGKYCPGTRQHADKRRPQNFLGTFLRLNILGHHQKGGEKF